MNSESRLQAEIFQHHWNNYPHERGLLFHVNNKARNAIEGNRFKAMGVVRGVSDLIYLKPGGRPLLMELKLDEGKQSSEQLKWEALVKEAGYNYVIVRSLEEAVKYFS
jgi:hypothetical protein